MFLMALSSASLSIHLLLCHVLLIFRDSILTLAGQACFIVCTCLVGGARRMHLHVHWPVQMLCAFPPVIATDKVQRSKHIRGDDVRHQHIRAEDSTYARKRIFHTTAGVSVILHYISILLSYLRPPKRSLPVLTTSSLQKAPSI